MDKKTRKMAICDIQGLVKERYRTKHYKVRGFFDHVRRTFYDIYKSDPSDEDIESMLLSRGNLVILQNKERSQAILNFQTAGDGFSSVEGLVQAGELYEDM
jgi:abortive infection bacteriophage resistance protein